MGSNLSLDYFQVTALIASILAVIPQLPADAQALIPVAVMEFAVSVNPIARLISIADFLLRYVPWNTLWEYVQNIFSRTEDRISAYSHLLSRAVEGPGGNSR